MSNRVTQGSQFNFSLALGWKDILVSPVDDIFGLIDVAMKVKNKDMGSIRLHPLVFGISAVTGMRALTIGNFWTSQPAGRARISRRAYPISL